MKILRIKKDYQKLLEENGLGAMYICDYDIQYASNRVLDISKFRFMLHKIVELLDLQDKEILDKEISNNNFTNLILNGILEIAYKPTVQNEIEQNFENRDARIIFSKNGNGFLSTKITLPVPWIRKMGFDENNRNATILYSDGKIIISQKEEH